MPLCSGVLLCSKLCQHNPPKFTLEVDSERRRILLHQGRTQSPRNRNVRIIAGSVCSFECCTYCLCSYAKLALFVIRFLSTKVRKGRGYVSDILREIDFQLFTSFTRMGSISEYFSSLLIPYSRCLHRNFEFLKNPIFKFYYHF